MHRPYPGVALVATEHGSVLLGAPADAFKATKRYCQEHGLPFPRVLVAPQTMLVAATPQFAPEFFLYDFLFVYGAAFKPELASERLQLVLDEDHVEQEKLALRMTLVGPSRDELAGYLNVDGTPALTPDICARLANVSEHMAIKKAGGVPRSVDDMIEVVTFDRHGRAKLLGGHLDVHRRGPQGFDVQLDKHRAHVDLTFAAPVVPFSTLPAPEAPERPLCFGIKTLGTRSGFDLSGPTTGFLIWVNGRAVIYDGPVGTRYLLESQGLSFSDVDAVILSHCHEDHMGAFVELILAGHRPKVLTAEPIYRSALVKMANYFQRPEEEVAAYLDYQRITPGEPLELLGATFDFFYTIHAIPTIGVSVSMRDADGHAHRIQVSGDTLHHGGLDDLHAKGVIDNVTHRSMRELIPSTRVEHALFFADVGESIIHGHPKDWQGNPNDVLYYHCPDNEHTRSFGHAVASPAKTYALIEPPLLHPATAARLWHALRFVDMRDPGWFSALLFQGRSRTVATGESVAGSADATASGRSFSVIVSGSASVVDGDGRPVTSLKPGEILGLVELIDDTGRRTADIRAETPMELFDLDAGLFYDYVRREGLSELVRRVWNQRPMVESATLFRRLDGAVRDRIASIATAEEHSAGTLIVEQGKKGDDFFLLVDGEVDVQVGGKKVATIAATQPDNFFGEISAVYPSRPRSASVRAKTRVRTLRIRGDQIRDLFAGDMGVRYALAVAIRNRGG
ncbi:MAG: cyclic nucleotide-binding domain-containing protein [Myxococcota bacterium]